MSRPAHADLAAALGIDLHRVSQLARRGMPVATITKARDWFAKNGFVSRNHAKPGGAQMLPLSKRIARGRW